MAWTRESIKNYAKDFLRKYYWKAFLVCLVVTILGGGVRNNNRTKIIKEYKPKKQIERFIKNEVDLKSKDKLIDSINKSIKKSPILTIPKFLIKTVFSLVFGIFALLMLILKITVGYSLEVGKNRFFLKGFKGDANAGNLVSAFNPSEYIGVVKTQFLRHLYTFLWSLLFVIPGIIKSYEYSMVPYILAEYPNLSTDEVLQISKDMTYGHKMDMFILDLSFIGWYFLGSLLFGIGILFVDPYKEATYARLYNVLAGNDDIGGKVFV